MKKNSFIYGCVALSISAALLSPSLMRADIPAVPAAMAPGADGSYARAVEMLRHGNYAGVIDMASQVLAAPDPLLQGPLAGDGSQTRLKALSIMLRAAYERGDDALFNTCMTAVTEGYQGTPEALEAALLHADMLFFKTDYPAAVKAYSAIDTDSLDPAKAALYRYRKALSLTKTGYFREARDLFTLLRGNPEYSGPSRFYLAYLDYVTGHLDDARDGFRSVPADIARELGAQYYLAQIDFQQGDFTAVINRVPSLISGAPESWKPELNRILGESYYNSGEPAQAEPYLRSYIAADKEPQYSALYDLGVICYDKNDYDGAREYLNPLLRNADKDAMTQSASLYLGQIAASEADWSMAAMLFRSAYEDDFDPKVAETALYDYAVATVKGGQVPFGSSAQMLEEFVNRYPASPYAATIDQYLATACFNDKDFQGALRHIERLRRPSHADLLAKQKILFQLGVQAKGSGDNAGAASYMGRAADMADRADRDLAAQASLWQGDALYAAGQYPAATKAYTRFVTDASRSSDNRALGLYNLAYSLYQEKKFPSARKRFAEAVAARPALSAPLASDARMRMADCDYYAGNVSSAMSAYESLASEAGNDQADYAAFQHANLLGTTGDYASQIRELDAMLRRWPSSVWAPDARRELVTALCAAGNLSRAADEVAAMKKEYPSAEQNRGALLALAAAYQEKGLADKAVESYESLVRQWPTSSEAEAAVGALRTIYAERGDMQGFLSFLDSVPSAPRPGADEMDDLAFEAAMSRVRQSDNSQTAPLLDYLEKYPDGANADRALLTMADICNEKGDTTTALTYLNRILTRRADSPSAPAAMMMKAQILEQTASPAQAAAVWKELMATGNSLYIPQATAGLMRTAPSEAETIRYADKLLATPGADAELRDEASLAKGTALVSLGRYDEAESVLAPLAERPQSLQGARAAVELGEAYLAQGKPSRALTVLRDFTDSNTRQYYWLARGYIALADTYNAMGDKNKAKEYLRALRNNYPGDEPDITRMIDSRLASWK